MVVGVAGVAARVAAATVAAMGAGTAVLRLQEEGGAAMWDTMFAWMLPQHAIRGCFSAPLVRVVESQHHHVMMLGVSACQAPICIAPQRVA